jgi:Flp pilus assembly protein TadD
MVARAHVVIALLGILPVWGASDYVGSAACARCHPAQYRDFQRTSMARSVRPVSIQSAPEFAQPVQFVHPKTGRRYRIFQQQSQFLIDEFFLDSGGRQVYSDPRTVSCVIGSGNHARSFLVESSHRLYQAPVTFYTQIPSWDMSPGYDTGSHLGFTRRVTADCLFCHAGRVNAAGRAGDRFEEAGPFAEVSIGCERCHGPGREHLAHPGRSIVNPARLSPRLREQVCEQCHLFGAARILQPGKVAADFRPGLPLEEIFAIYNYDISGPAALKVTGHSEQMKRSRCWQGSQDGLWCGTCHAVHASQPATNRTAFYRSKCLTCHTIQTCSRKREPASAPNRDDDCIGCHMPKRTVVESAHVTFTDHEIARRPQTAPPTEPDMTKLRQLLTPASNVAILARNLGFAQLQVAGASGRAEFLRAAIDTLEPLQESNVGDAEFWMNLGSAYVGTRQYDKAEAAFRKAIAQDPKSAAGYYSLGFLYQSQKVFPQAIPAYREALARDAEMVEAWGNLAAAYLAMDNKMQAAQSLETALRLDPGNLEWRRALQVLSAEHR